MLNTGDILQTIKMIENQHLDIRTITMGISLLDCIDPDPDACCRKIYDKITRLAANLVQVGQDIEHEYGIPVKASFLFQPAGQSPVGRQGARESSE